MSQERTELCETCRFWDHDGRDGFAGNTKQPPDRENDISDCRRYPPVSGINSEAGENFLPHFPTTRAWSWCGEWKPIALPTVETQPDAKLSRPVRSRDFGFGVTTANVLESNRIDTLGDLLQLTPEEILAFKGIGVTSLWRIRRGLEDIGLKLKGD